MTVEVAASTPLARLIVFGNAALGAEIGRSMVKLSPEPGDIVVVRLPWPTTPFDDPPAEQRRREYLLGQVAAALEAAGAEQTVLLAVPEGYDLSILPVESMRRLGWIRVEEADLRVEEAEEAERLPEHLKGWSTDNPRFPAEKLDEVAARRHVDETLSTLATPSTGDDEADQDFLRQYAERDARIQQGFCPNHPTEPTRLVRAPDNSTEAVCSRCEFRYGRSTIIVPEGS